MVTRSPTAWTWSTCVERFFYRPLYKVVLRVARAALRLQSGRLDAYMAYMLIAVLAVLAVVIATS